MFQWILVILGAALLLYAGLVALLALFQERLLYFPTRGMVDTPASAGLAYETIHFSAADGAPLTGWFVPAPNSRRVLLFFHGNGGNISYRVQSIAQFHRLGLNVFIIDYRHYGQSGGPFPTEAGTYLDAEAAWRYLTETRQVSPEQIIIFGRSLGGAVAAALAEQHPPPALILESTFTSVPDMAARRFPFVPVRRLGRIEYNTRDRLARIPSPKLIIHSPTDEVIPFDHGQALFAAARLPKEFLQITGGHNNGYIISAQQYEPAVREFLDSVMD